MSAIDERDPSTIADDKPSSLTVTLHFDARAAALLENMAISNQTSLADTLATAVRFPLARFDGVAGGNSEARDRWRAAHRDDALDAVVEWVTA